MNAPHIRLQAARRKAGYDTASDAARAFGWNENTYRSHENGERGLRPGVAAQYARAFKSNPSWILLGETAKFSVDFREDEHILIFKDYIISYKGLDDREYRVDTIMFYTELPHRYLLIYSDALRPRFERHDLAVLTPASDENADNNTGFLVTTERDELFFGNLFKMDGKTVLQTVDKNLISSNRFKKLETVMAIIRRPFYELAYFDPTG